ncbi:signal transduction histidine kinase [Methylobacterium sp. BE186]|uniref:ATP-binding protein n=1 Tax=Methylobacterium sp. BE186 TaxID=2817715 RepID=UPI002862E4A1|nr:ATP-binding protein [Methylobacterium sp. BE186]MDR7036426.1 signal transduction histidine kinase [Methylobacterium sp. BE186]
MTEDGSAPDKSLANDPVAPALDSWAREPRLAALLADPGRAFAILDAEGAHLLEASAPARPWAAGLFDPAGAAASRLGLPGQILRAALPAEGSRLVRLRLDPRGIAPPVPCLLARGRLANGEAALLLVPMESLPAARRREPRPDVPLPVAEAEAVSVAPDEVTRSAEPAARPRPGDRFVWRSDGSDLITQVSGGPEAALAPLLLGRSWSALARDGVLREGEPLLAALAERRTFRGVPAGIALGEAVEPIGVEISGAPLGRNGHPFTGYGGFGLVRAAAGSPAQADPEPTSGRAEVGAIPVSLGADEGGPAPAADVPALGDATLLSVSEHAAFREIARALGARFAGDEAAPDPDYPQQGAAVMPFPVGRLAENRLAEAGPGEAPPLLDDLPAAILIRRDDTLLYANRAFLDLAGFADLAAFQAAGGLARLILRHDGTEGGGNDRLITREDGVRPVAVARGETRWGGHAAEILVVDPRPADLPVPAPMPPAPRGQSVLERALDAIEDGILALDAEHRVVALNRAAADLLGRDAAALPGQALLALFTPESAIALRAALHGPAPAAREVTARGRAGAIPLALRLGPPSPDGSRLAILRDLSETRRLAAAADRAVAQAEAAEAWKANFLAKVSHEIRTPMNGILGFADVMLNEQFGPVPERYRDYLRDIHASGEHVLGLVNDLVDLAKIEAGRLDLAFGPVPLNDLVSSCVALLQPQAARDRIVVRTSFSADLTTLVADERSMRQAALNVIANAIRFTEAGGQVIVSTTIAERGEIALRVRDTGIGMSAEEIASALEPFRTAAIAVPRKGGGTGLGLPLTKALVEANRGRFQITSRKDEGTLVEILFPARAAMSA